MTCQQMHNHWLNIHVWHVLATLIALRLIEKAIWEAFLGVVSLTRGTHERPV